MNYPYWVAIGLLMLGLYTMIAHRNLLKKLIGMAIFQTAIILFFMLISVKRGATLPIVEMSLLVMLPPLLMSEIDSVTAKRPISAAVRLMPS